MYMTALPPVTSPDPSLPPVTPQFAQDPSAPVSTLSHSLLGTQPQATPLPTDVIPAAAISDDEKLELFESILSRVGAPAQSTTQSTAQPSGQPQQPVSPSLAQSSQTPDQPQQPSPQVGGRMAVERAGGTVQTAEVPGLTTVEYEPQPEIPVEVEGFLERVADHTEALPQEIVIQGNDIALNQQAPPTQSVIVVPITQETEDEAKGKNPSWSIAWLVEWSHRLIKKYVGKVVYRHPPAQSTGEPA